MALILHIETATPICSVTLADNGNMLATKETSEPNAHSASLTQFIKDLFHQSKLPMSELKAVAVSMGPGSYTGLRIGVSTAKGICYALDIPLIAVSTLQAMAHTMTLHNSIEILYCPMIDAKRMEVYNAIFTHTNEMTTPITADIIDENSYAELLVKHKILFFGNGAAKCKTVIQHANATFNEDYIPSATDLVAIALSKYNKQEFVDLAYFEPFYLKDFIAGKPRIKGLYSS